MDGDWRPVVVHLVHSLSGGGTERTLVDLLQGLDSRRLNHVVVTLRDAGELAARLPSAVPCYPLSADGRRVGLGFAVGRVARRRRALVLHARNTCTWGDAMLASFLIPRASVILGFHGLEHSGGFSAKVRLIARWARWKGVRFATNSWAGSEQLVSDLRIPTECITVIPNGVRLARFAKAARLRRSREHSDAAATGGACVIGTVGSLTRVKRLDLLIQAVAFMSHKGRNVRLILVGDGPQREELTALASSLGLSDRVQFAGPQADVADWLARMDVFVCCSDSEGMSCALLEAAASWLPIVATNVGDNARVVRDGEGGVIVPAGQVDALAGGLTRLVKSAELRRRMGQAAGRRATEYSAEGMIAAYEAFYAAQAHDAGRVHAAAPIDRSRRPRVAFGRFQVEADRASGNVGGETACVSK